ncbi:alpha/beta fold hydrolase [Profundibacterium mesophilum]|uniref:3-oxoadipate enol-lactonase n=1 Tax=Profundibacterium mesophilum KAUST100406-0324 TaxID=1037889 RepID=A0A921TG12_9RHOB|nr:alpha/beta fold hydrolase [Profundibacterium mesophilum]KAF0676994.1 3-oxoadipate enol-lactonase [Profundibacterium mesophilum KAUST100406-0324]
MSVEPIVLLPGLMNDVRIWGPQIETLSVDHGLYLPAWGAGDSVGDIAAHVLSEAPPRFALAGISLGAMIAMEILAQAPDRVTRIALLGTACLAETPANAAAREINIVHAKTGRLAEALVAEYPPEAMAEGPMRQPIAEFLIEMGLRLGPEAYLRQAKAITKRPDLQRVLRQARLPALVLCGADDTLYRPRRHEFMAELLHDGMLCIVPGAGHAPTLEQPAAVNAALREWLGRPDRRRPRL